MATTDVIKQPEGVTGGSLKQPGSVTPEQWWTKHAGLMAQKMKLGGVKSFRIELTERGTYEFEVVPDGSLKQIAQRQAANNQDA